MSAGIAATIRRALRRLLPTTLLVSLSNSFAHNSTIKLPNYERPTVKSFAKLPLLALPMLLASCGFLQPKPPAPVYKPAQMPPLPPEIAEKVPVNSSDRLLKLLSPSQPTATVPPQKQTPASTPTTK